MHRHLCSQCRAVITLDELSEAIAQHSMLSVLIRPFLLVVLFIPTRA